MSSILLSLCYLTHFYDFRFYGVDTEQQLLEEATKAYKKGKFIAGIVFMDMPGEDNSRQKRAVPSAEMPKHIKYKIRMDIDNVETTFQTQKL